MRDFYNRAGRTRQFEQLHKAPIHYAFTFRPLDEIARPVLDRLAADATRRGLKSRGAL
jgi:hypothetical protein